MVTKCCSAYCQDFAIPFLYQGVIAERRGDMVMVGEVLSVCPSVTLFCVQLLIQFLCDLNKTFTVVMVGEVPSVHPSVRLSVRHILLCATSPTVLMRFQPNFHRMIVTKCLRAYCQYFAIPLFIRELMPFV